MFHAFNIFFAFEKSSIRKLNNFELFTQLVISFLLTIIIKIAMLAS